MHERYYRILLWGPHMKQWTTQSANLSSEISATYCHNDGKWKRWTLWLPNLWYLVVGSHLSEPTITGIWRKVQEERNIAKASAARRSVAHPSHRVEQVNIISPEIQSGYLHHNRHLFSHDNEKSWPVFSLLLLTHILPLKPFLSSSSPDPSSPSVSSSVSMQILNYLFQNKSPPPNPKEVSQCSPPPQPHRYVTDQPKKAFQRRRCKLHELWW